MYVVRITVMPREQTEILGSIIYNNNSCYHLYI